MWPIVMHHNPKYNSSEAPLIYNNTEYMIWGSDFGAPDNCLREACVNDFYIQRQEEYFMFTNWDQERVRVVKLYVDEYDDVEV